MAGLGFSEIAQMVGTSTYHAENTYQHLQDATRKKFAFADYRLIDGINVPVFDELLSEVEQKRASVNG